MFFRLPVIQFRRIVAYGLQESNETIWRMIMTRNTNVPEMIGNQDFWILAYANDEIREKYIKLTMSKDSNYTSAYVYHIFTYAFFYERRNIDWGLNFFIKNFDNIKQL